MIEGTGFHDTRGWRICNRKWIKNDNSRQGTRTLTWRRKRQVENQFFRLHEATWRFFFNQNHQTELQHYLRLHFTWPIYSVCGHCQVSVRITGLKESESNESDLLITFSIIRFCYLLYCPRRQAEFHLVRQVHSLQDYWQNLPYVWMCFLSTYS